MTQERGTAFAWVESPLQLLGAIEYSRASGTPLRVIPRSGAVQMPATITRVRRLGLPDTVTIERSRLSPVAALRAYRGHWVLGDALSGFARSALAVDRQARLTLLDDGTDSLLLGPVLAGDAPLERAGRNEPVHVRALSGVARRTLSELADAGRLELFSAFPIDHPALVPNTFEWVRATAARAVATSPIVLGSAAVTDRLVDADSYLDWVAGHAPARYYPHRREHGGTLSRLGALEGVAVQDSGLPIELVLAGHSSVRLVSLPSSALRTLELVLAGLDARLEASSIQRAQV